MWVLVAIATPRWGMLGFAVGYCIPVVVGNLVVLVYLKRLFPGARFLRRYWASVLAGAGVWGLCRYVLAGWIDGASSPGAAVGLLVGSIALAVVAHAALLFALDRRGVFAALSLVPAVSRK
jgi:hypothetical protein